jgi:hypothetical protein
LADCRDGYGPSPLTYRFNGGSRWADLTEQLSLAPSRQAQNAAFAYPESIVKRRGAGCLHGKFGLRRAGSNFDQSLSFSRSFASALVLLVLWVGESH